MDFNFKQGISVSKRVVILRIERERLITEKERRSLDRFLVFGSTIYLPLSAPAEKASTSLIKQVSALST